MIVNKKAKEAARRRFRADQRRSGKSKTVGVYVKNGQFSKNVVEGAVLHQTNLLLGVVNDMPYFFIDGL